MQGYLKPNFKEMPLELKKEYKAFYCGLCKALKKQCGYIGIASLSYEITALVILLSGLQEHSKKVFHGSCCISPFVPVSYVDYFCDELVCAANLSFLITCYEVKDNMHDIGGFKWRTIDRLLNRKIDKSINALNADFLQIHNAVYEYYATEHKESVTFQEVVEASGALVENLVFPLIKNCACDVLDNLKELSNLLGKWIYLIDACDDLTSDIKNGNFNPLLLITDLSGEENTIQSIELKIFNIIKELPIYTYQNLIEYIFIYNLSDKSKKINKNIILQK